MNSDQVKNITAPENDKGVGTWLNGHAKQDFLLLAFADDGVIWGRPENNVWKISHDIFGKPFAQLRGNTLQEAFVFGKDNQIHLYRNGDLWVAKDVVDAGEWIEESQILWGNKWEAQSEGFTHLSDRVQETLEHAIPLVIANKEDLDQKAVRLKLHHYVETDEETGETRIFLSRLVKLELGSREK